MSMPSVRVWRGDLIESRHRVHAAVSDPSGRVVCWWGSDTLSVFLRSAAKPFQAAAVVASGACDRFGLDERQLAIVAASHSGQDEHVRVVESVLERIGLDAASLRCGVHPPLHADTAERIGRGATALHHNCSGKHAGMLALGLHLGAPPETYLDPGGPVQRLVCETLARAAGLRPEDLRVATDGCSAPTFALPLAAGARAFARLSRPEDAPDGLREPLARVAMAMTRHPHLIGGTGRFDTRLMEASDTRLLAKAGAEGVQGIADHESGRGLVLKIEDGTARAVGPAALEIVRLSSWIDAPTLERLADLWRPEIRNHAGRVVGRIEAVLPQPRS